MRSLEERRNIGKATRFVFLTIVVGVLLFFYGIPALGRFAAFVSELAKSDKPISKNDTTPPAPPQIDTLPEYTNKPKLSITGKSEEGATIKFILNSEAKEVVADRDGKFSLDFTLDDGENGITASATDLAGNESVKTKTFKITFDDEEPKLILDGPSNGSQFFGTRQRQVDIKGSVDDSNTQVTINDRFVAVEDNGSFQFTTTLSEGENKFKIKAVDLAGNSSEKELTLNFTP